MLENIQWLPVCHLRTINRQNLIFFDLVSCLHLTHTPSFGYAISFSCPWVIFSLSLAVFPALNLIWDAEILCSFQGPNEMIFSPHLIPTSFCC